MTVRCFWLLWELSGRALFFGFQVSSKDSDPKTQQSWINAMPNKRGTSGTKKTLWNCQKRNCSCVPFQGGKQPSAPPANFAGVKKSCLKLNNAKSHTKKSKTSEIRRKKQKESQRWEYRDESTVFKNVFCNFMSNILTRKNWECFKQMTSEKTSLHFVLKCI